MDPAIAVVVPVRDAADTLARTLTALEAQTLAPGGYEVVVVDDGSRDGSAAIARGFAAAARRCRMTVIAQPADGPGEARNAGVMSTRAPRLAFCDADVVPRADWLAAGRAALESADLVQGRVLPDPRATLGPFDRTIWVTHEAGLYETANLFVTRELFDRVGGFEQWLRPRRGKALAEDVWFGERCRRTGARTAFCDGAIAHHAVFARSPAAYAAERARLRYFPAMVGQMPALRERFLHRRVFLNRRTMRFDLALAGLAAARLARHPVPALAALPYLRALHEHAAARADRGHGWAAVALADLAADAVGAGALIAGSLATRAPVL
jgi:glycosyltransferase involved in cell wall biosynthesis